MSLRRCESPGVIAQIAALSVDHAPTAIIGCPYTSRHDNAPLPVVRIECERGGRAGRYALARLRLEFLISSHFTVLA
jgi:hypothetical protein